MTGFFVIYKGVIIIRISEILGSNEPKKKKNRLKIGLLITGSLSLLVILITIYGQYAGNAVITMTKNANGKGILISDNKEFNNGVSTLKFEPINEVEDILEGAIDIETAENNDGLYHVEGEHYFAYTFYLRNTGKEVIDLGYNIKITQDYKNIANATFFKVRKSSYIDGVAKLETDTNYSKALTNNDLIANTNVGRLNPGETKRFTMFVWLDGEHTTPEMLGGFVKFDWTFVILNSGGDK